MLKGKIAVVTGGTRGIGYAIVKKYLENGAKVILFGSRQETVDKALASLKEENPEWEVSGACPSLTDAKEVADEIQAIHRKYGKIDILDILLKTNITKSRGEGRRLVQQGGVSVDDKKVTDIGLSFTSDDLKANAIIVKKGKKIFHKVQA